MPQPTWVLLLTMSIPLWLQCTHLLMATSSRIMHHVTKLKSSQTGFLNMTMSSLYKNGTFGMWWNGRFASWMCSRQICSNCVILSCQYGPKSLRNVSNTLLNLCHEGLRQFWRQKGVQAGTSKVYLIKWPVSVYCIYYRGFRFFHETFHRPSQAQIFIPLREKIK